MDDRRFDALTRQLGQAGSRRTLLKTLIGLGGVAATGAILRDTDAARRGYSGPPIPPPLPTATAQPTFAPTQTSQPTNTPNSCGSSGVCCTGDTDCRVIPTYCDSTQQYPLLWRYHLCSSGSCVQTAHVCNIASGNCQIDVCDDQTGCAVANVTPGQMGSQGAICCTDSSHCASLPRFCDGGDWHYYDCHGLSCQERIEQCGAGLCQEPIGCQIVAPE